MGRGRLTPYLLLLPGGLWLIVFFAIPMAIMLSVSLQEGSLDTGYHADLELRDLSAGHRPVR